MARFADEVGIPDAVAVFRAHTTFVGVQGWKNGTFAAVLIGRHVFNIGTVRIPNVAMRGE